MAKQVSNARRKKHLGPIIDNREHFQVRCLDCKGVCCSGCSGEFEPLRTEKCSFCGSPNIEFDKNKSLFD